MQIELIKRFISFRFEKCFSEEYTNWLETIELNNNSLENIKYTN